MTEGSTPERDGSDVASEPPTIESGHSAVEWRYDAETSRLLRLLAHGFVAGLGGPLVLVGSALLLALPDLLPGLDLGILLFVALLALVGGPFSLLYLWPMLADAEQRPGPEAFTGEIRTFPWTARSTAGATVAGVTLFGGLAVVGTPGDALFALAVVLIFSPVVVNLFSTVGRFDGDRFVCNGQEVALSCVTGVRSIRVGDVLVCWVSYARGTGLLVPRLLTVPGEVADEVLAALEGGVDAQPPEFRGVDRTVRLVVCGAGLLFVGVAAVAVRATDDPVVGAYLGGVLGLVGVVLLVAGWRGV